MTFSFRLLRLDSGSHSIEVDDSLARPDPIRDGLKRELDERQRGNDLPVDDERTSELYDEIDARWSLHDEATWAARGIADGALELFCGGYPTTPLYFPDETITLPWHGEYWSLEGNVYRRKDGSQLRAEIESIASQLLYPDTDVPDEPYAHGPLLWWDDESPLQATTRSQAQALATEALFASEGALRALLEDAGLRCACWLAYGYERLIDAATALRPLAAAADQARKAAFARHRENYALRDQVVAWYKENHVQFSSIEAAAEAAFRSRLVPAKYSTLRTWISQARKGMQSAGRLKT